MLFNGSGCSYFSTYKINNLYHNSTLICLSVRLCYTKFCIFSWIFRQIRFCYFTRSPEQVYFFQVLFAASYHFHRSSFFLLFSLVFYCVVFFSLLLLLPLYNNSNNNKNPCIQYVFFRASSHQHFSSIHIWVKKI